MSALYEYVTSYEGDGYTIEEVQATYPNGVVLSAASEIGVEEEEVTTMVTCTDGTRVKAYTLGEVEITDWCVESDAFTFSDGTTADLWKSGYYYLKDGTRSRVSSAGHLL